MWQLFKKNKIVQMLASLKLAVFIILIYTVLMAWGTTTESLYGAEFAKWRVYFSPIFIAVQVLLFLNILFAALVRFPYQSRLKGFYIIHLGLLILFIGATVTAVYGIDGTLQLQPQVPNTTVLINEPTLYASLQQNDDEIDKTKKALPKTVSPYTQTDKPFLQLNDYDIFVESYLPYAIPKISWQDTPPGSRDTEILQIDVKNAFATQNLELSNITYSSSFKKIGPLTLSLLVKFHHDCFEKNIKNKEVKFLYQDGTSCFPLAQNQTEQIFGNTKIIQVKEKPFLHYQVSVNSTGQKNPDILNFFPALSFYPVNVKDFIIEEKSQAHLVNLDLIRQTPQVIFLKDNWVGFGKDVSWSFQAYKVFEDIKLPWMNSTLTITRHLKNKQQHTEWVYALPIGGQENKEKRYRAAHLKIVNKKTPANPLFVWAENTRVARVKVGDAETLELALGQKTFSLPFEVELERFQMNTNPGTNEPASYESYVKVTDIRSSEKYKIFMNHPLKKEKLTLYQASYFPLEDGNFGSVLSVNHDPGRILKYLGSFLIVFGAILHYVIRRQKTA